MYERLKVNKGPCYLYHMNITADWTDSGMQAAVVTPAYAVVQITNSIFRTNSLPFNSGNYTSHIVTSISGGDVRMLRGVYASPPTFPFNVRKYPSFKTELLPRSHVQIPAILRFSWFSSVPPDKYRDSIP
jgi:hypothetical protein